MQEYNRVVDHTTLASNTSGGNSMSSGAETVNGDGSVNTASSVPLEFLGVGNKRWELLK